MKLGDLCEVFEVHGFPSLGQAAHPERDSVLRARAAVAAAVVDDEFLVDCMSLELKRIEEERLRRGLVPFFCTPRFRSTFRIRLLAPRRDVRASRAYSVDDHRRLQK